ncbi:unnamed protein product [Caenorhabditis auriculariae]|uniref:Uncharacterized protein n=1 Tax=Caenorhabditis auriculariae TaxID=2777116 RepID=A0A8S1GZ40_9PELO|nr:unnamed protein product [Caenorhabditis auriculariae]
MDMIAYKFVVSQKQTTITHLPDGISIELEKMPVIFSAEEYCCDFKGASGAVYSLYHIRVPSALKHQKKGLRRLWSLPENLHEPKNDLLLTAVFPHYVHQQLAMRQVKKLHEILSNIASQVSIFYQ